MNFSFGIVGWQLEPALDARVDLDRRLDDVDRRLEDTDRRLEDTDLTLPLALDEALSLRRLE